MLAQEFEYGQTEALDLSVIASRLQGFFEERSTHPMILLVHDQGPSLNVLRNCGVDTSTWEVGITGLIGFKLKVCDTEFMCASSPTTTLSRPEQS